MSKKVEKIAVSQEEIINMMLTSLVGEIFLESLTDNIVDKQRIYNRTVKNSTEKTIRQLDSAITDMVYADTGTSVEEFRQLKNLVRGEFQDVIISLRTQILATLKIKE